MKSARMLKRMTVWVVIVVMGISALAGCTAPGAGQVAAPATADAVQAVNQKITPADYQQKFGEGSAAHTLVDVRTPEEFAGGHIAGSANINVEELSQRLSEVPKDKPVVLYCRSGNRSAKAAQILAEAGYTEVYDLGGIQTWTEQGYPVQ